MVGLLSCALASAVLLASCGLPSKPLPPIDLPPGARERPIAEKSDPSKHSPSRVNAKLTSKAPTIPAITFAVERHVIYLPLDEVHQHLGGRRSSLEKLASTRTLVDGRPLITLRALEKYGAKVRWRENGRDADVRRRWRAFTAIVGPKHTEINLAQQRLRAWQGGRLVLESRISSGRRGSTPAGRFRAGPYKARRHYSSLYDNAPMPWSVQVTGHVFIHGFTSVPNYPASHGCIRLPLNEGNPAKFFYEWIDRGTRIHVKRS